MSKKIRLNRMLKIMNSLKMNGFTKTVVIIINRILKTFGLQVSETYFFQIDLDDAKLQNNNQKLYKLEYLGYDRKMQFESIKYFEFLDVNNLLASNKADILIALDGSKIIGYICVHRGINHLIHNLGYWNLNEDEAWIGPTYIIKDYRNKGIHKDLINVIIKDSYSKGIKKIYTAINSKNIPSIRSFSKVGFKLIGRINNRKIISKSISLELLDINDNNILKKKFEVLG